MLAGGGREGKEREGKEGRKGGKERREGKEKERALLFFWPCSGSWSEGSIEDYDRLLLITLIMFLWATADVMLALMVVWTVWIPGLS